MRAESHIARFLARLLLLAAIMVGALLLYVPFLFLGDRYNRSSLAGSNDFYYWFSIAIWPEYSFLVPLLVQMGASLLRVRWYLQVPVLVATFCLWSEAWGRVGPWLGIDGFGDTGLFTYAVNLDNPSGLSTPQMSFYLCPVAFLAGGAAGGIVGIWFRRVGKPGKAKLHGLWRAGIAAAAGCVYGALAILGTGDWLSDWMWQHGYANVWSMTLLGLAGWFLPVFGIPILVYALLTRHFGPGSSGEGPRCPACGYILIGLSEPRCPECGRPSPPCLHCDTKEADLNTLAAGDRHT